MTDYLIKEDVFMALTGDITDCTIEEFIARLRDKLSKLPSVGKDINVTTNEDCISRQAVDELSKELVHTTRDKADFLCNFWEGLQKLPSVTPKEKTGKWFVDERPESDREVICSNCEQPVFKYHKLEFDYRPKFCPNCGARMD